MNEGAVILTSGWHDDERRSGAALQGIRSGILRPRVSLLESCCDKC